MSATAATVPGASGPPRGRGGPAGATARSPEAGGPGLRASGPRRRSGPLEGPRKAVPGRLQRAMTAGAGVLRSVASLRRPAGLAGACPPTGPTWTEAASCATWPPWAGLAGAWPPPSRTETPRSARPVRLPRHRSGPCGCRLVVTAAPRTWDHRAPSYHRRPCRWDAASLGPAGGPRRKPARRRRGTPTPSAATSRASGTAPVDRARRVPRPPGGRPAVGGGHVPTVNRATEKVVGDVAQAGAATARGGRRHALHRAGPGGEPEGQAHRGQQRVRHLRPARPPDRRGAPGRPEHGQEGHPPARLLRPVHDPQAPGRRLHGNVLLALTRPAKVLKSTVIVQDGHGHEIGHIVQQNAIGKIRFALEAGGAPGARSTPRTGGPGTSTSRTTPAPRSPASPRRGRAWPRPCSPRPTTTWCRSTAARGPAAHAGGRRPRRRHRPQAGRPRLRPMAQAGRLWTRLHDAHPPISGARGRGPRLAEDLTPARRPHLGAAAPGLRRPRPRSCPGPTACWPGGRCAEEAFRQVDPDSRRRGRPTTATGSPPGRAFADVDGPLASILTAERTALNFLGHLSGVATLTARFVGRRRGRWRPAGVGHPQDHARPAGAGEGGGAGRRRVQPPGQPVRLGPAQGQPPRGARHHRGRRPRPAPLAGPDGPRRVRRPPDQVREAVEAGADALLLDNMAPDEVGPWWPRSAAEHRPAAARGLGRRRPGDDRRPTPPPGPTWCRSAR